METCAIVNILFLQFQLFDNRTYTYTYILADKQSRDGIIIDPVIELVNRDLHIVMDLGVNLKYACKFDTYFSIIHFSFTTFLKF